MPEDGHDTLPVPRGGLPDRRGGTPALRAGAPSTQPASDASPTFASPGEIAVAFGASPLLTIAFAVAVAVAFADSSIVTLALPELYSQLETTIVGVSWVITGYNLVVAVGAFALLPLMRRARPAMLAAIGLVVFLGASIGAGVSDNLPALVASRCVQGAGAALLLSASLSILGALAGSSRGGLAVWTVAGAVGVAVGPALGGILTEAFDWRAIFIAQAPVAGIALLGALSTAARRVGPDAGRSRPREAVGANLGLVCIFGSLVGALFLSVLLVVVVWDLGPLAGAGVVSALPLAALAARPLATRLDGDLDVIAGALLLAAGLVALALLPSTNAAYATAGLAVCGVGFGLAVPVLTQSSVGSGLDLGRRGTISIGARHAGLVLALVAIAPLLGTSLSSGGDRARINATAVILNSPMSLVTKVPIALDLNSELAKTPDGQIPDLKKPFDENGAATDPAVRETRDDLVDAIRGALTRSFRPAFGLAALFAALTLVPVVLVRRRIIR
jgi:predicted MFS family arabinose efflux permease